MNIMIGTYGAGVQQWSSSCPEQAVPLANAQDPSWMLPVGGDRLYLAEECLGCPEGKVALLRRENGVFVRVQTVRSEGENPCHLALSPDDRWLAAANYTSGSVALFEIKEDGSLALHRVFPGHHGGPHAKRQEGPHAHFVSFQPEGLLCCDLGADEVRRIVRCGEKWAETEPLLRLPAGVGPRHLLRCGSWLYVLCELSGELMTFALPEGTLCSRQKVCGEGAVGTGAALRMGADGLLYTSHRGGNCVSVYDLTEAAHPALLTRADCGGVWPRDILPIPGGVLCACQKSQEITLLRWQDGHLQMTARTEVTTPVMLCEEAL